MINLNVIADYFHVQVAILCRKAFSTCFHGYRCWHCRKSIMSWFFSWLSSMAVIYNHRLFTVQTSLDAHKVMSSAKIINQEEDIVGPQILWANFYWQQFISVDFCNIWKTHLINTLFHGQLHWGMQLSGKI